jgi:hypothetical protein
MDRILQILNLRLILYLNMPITAVTTQVTGNNLQELKNQAEKFAQDYASIKSSL